ncbi:MAG: class I SAM-dependent methyltransferase, partial [Fidelibacterota bacterium]
ATLDHPEGHRDIKLDAKMAHERYSLQLYDHLTEGVDLTGKDVLEVGSGRGGGAVFIHQTMNPRQMVGVDIASEAVDFCNRTHTQDGLSYKVGDAEKLPFEDDTMDVVLNLESSHCYPSMDAFLGEVKRVLRPGGLFLYADHRPRSHENAFRKKLQNSGMRIAREADITPNVIRAMEMDQERKLALIHERVPKSMANSIREFAATDDSTLRHEFVSGKRWYFSLTMENAAA